MCHCPFPLPPAPCHREQTVSFYQPSLFSKQLALQGGPAVSGPYQTGAGAHLEENRGEGGRGSLKLVLAGAWGPRGWNLRGRGFASGLQECPSVGNGIGPFCNQRPGWDQDYRKQQHWVGEDRGLPFARF